MKNKQILFILSAFLFHTVLFSQTDEEKELDKEMNESVLISLYKIAPDSTSARLRWGFKIKELFEYFPRTVYNIERTKINKKGLVVETRIIDSVKMVSADSAWEPIFKKDSATAVLRVKTMLLLDNDINPPFLTKKEVEDLFPNETDSIGFALGAMVLHLEETNAASRTKEENQTLEYNKFMETLLLEQNFEAAKNMGLAYEDTTIEKGFFYEYRVIPNMAFKPSTAMLFDFEAKENIDQKITTLERQVFLKWLPETEISSYSVLRSKVLPEGDEKEPEYTQVNRRPLMNLSSDPKARIQKVDSVSTYGKYNYNVLAFDTFGYVSGFYGPFEVSVIPFVGPPEIDEASIQSENEVDLRWKFNLPEEQEFIKEYTVIHSKSAEGKDARILETFEGNLNYKKLNFEVEPINYLQLIATDVKDKLHYSEIVMVQPIDSIAPLKPLFIDGAIDSVGVVTLNWKPNELDNDVASYHVFRSNIKEGSFGQVSGNAVELTKFSDTIVTSVSNKAVYYKIIAMDKRQNQSDFSEMIEIKRPDVFPPSPAVLTEWEIVDGEDIKLDWVNSSSEDLDYSVIYRAGTDESPPNWKEVLTTKAIDKVTSFLDTTTQRKNEYYYTMVAVDSVGLESKLTSPLHIIIPRGIITLKPVTKFSVRESLSGDKLTIVWKYKPIYNEEDEKFSFELYKENEQKEFVRKATIDFPIKQVEVSPSFIGEKATYFIKVINNYGDESKLTKQK